MDEKDTRFGDWIQTYTGRKFHFLDPRPEDIDIMDIAHALSMQCRYNGHCNFFYSVAQHSVLASKESQRRYPGNIDIAIGLLMHDAPEAYVSDVPRPIKRTIFGNMNMGVFHYAEGVVEKAILKKFGIKKVDRRIIKKIDNALLHTEMIQCMSTPPENWFLPEPPLDIQIKRLSQEVAKRAFLNMFSKLMSER